MRRLWPVALTAAMLVMVATQTQIGAQSQPKLAVYVSSGPELIHYDLDAANATLTRRASVMLPQGVQYAWQHPSKRYLYVGWSEGAGRTQHGVTAFVIDPGTGALRPHGEPLRLPARTIHLSTDISGRNLLIVDNPSGLSAYRLGADGTIGAQVVQATPLDVGIFAHQIRVDATNQMAILVTRGNLAAAGRPEDPGSLRVFGYDDGKLTNRAVIAPKGGFGFQARHLDYHPTRPWIFVSLENQNTFHVYQKAAGGTVSSDPLFVKDSLANPANVRPGQAASTVHVHPNGRFVYQGNRATGTEEFQGRRVFVGGENTIAVYSINQTTGEPTLIQSADTRGMSPRTFALDPSGRVLVAANQNSYLLRDGDQVNTVASNLSVFRVGADGKLEFVRKEDISPDPRANLFWMGVVALP